MSVDNNISLVVPSYNNLNHLKNLYNSVKKHEPNIELIVMDDASDDGTWEWLQDKDCVKYRTDVRLGHTILYDIGIGMASNDIVGILHADMIIGPNYVVNLIKHLKPKTVVCATRIEPPIHPEGREKIIKDFGMDFDTLDVDSFERYCVELQKSNNNKTTCGIFAPWILYKKDFESIGGHDPLFAPYGYEDSDIFQRWILAGYTMVQSRDAFVYHLTCRGHRWTKGIGIDNDDYSVTMKRKERLYLRKWGSWIKNDKFQHPILSPVYDKTIVINNDNHDILKKIEPLFNRIYLYSEHREACNSYLQSETEFYSSEPSQPLDNKLFMKFYFYTNNTIYFDGDIVVYLNGNNFDNNDMYTIINLNDIIAETNELGQFEVGNLKINIKSLKDRSSELINILK